MWFVEKLNVDNEKRDINTNPNSFFFSFGLSKWIKNVMLHWICNDGRKSYGMDNQAFCLRYEPFEISMGNSIRDL